MRATTLSLLLLALLVVPLAAARPEFRRERALREIEGKPPPALAVRDWMNTGGKKIRLRDLRGKVVILDFWGVW